MCGIAGFAPGPGSAEAISGILLDSLASRGPDGPWAAEHAGIHLAQTRLAVIDLSDRVTYPMPNERGDLWLAFNGEIYDHQLLRAELEGLGHVFATDCDAEVVVHGFEEWGNGVFQRLNGMFAAAVADERTGELTIARDAVGIKPLVHLTGPRFAFASEAMALVSAGLSRGEPDLEAIAEYAAFHYVPPTRTGIADIAQVEPGTAITRSPDGSLRTERWAARAFDGSSPEGPEVPLDEVERVIGAAVERQLVADVEVGVFLSSGVDSSLVATLAACAGARPKAFTIGFAGHGDYDELDGAARLADELGMPHHHEKLNVGFAEAVESVGKAYDQPFADSSALATLALAKLTRGHVTVALSGTGGDDAFAGYYRHRAHRLARLVGALPGPVLRRLARMDVDRGAERRGALPLAQSYASRLARSAAAGGDQGYPELVGAMTSPAGLGALRPPPDVASARQGVAKRLEGLGELDEGLRAIQRFEFGSYVPGDLLAKEDRATMAVGLEARVPLLDAEVIALAERMPDSQKISLRSGKLPLRELAARVVPTAGTSKRRKRGFAVPLADLLAGPWRDEALQWLGDAQSELVDTELAASLVDRRPSASPDVWALSTLVAWERRLAECRARGAAI